MQNVRLALLFLFGQAADFLTSWYAIEKLGAREVNRFNPWLRKKVNTRKWWMVGLLKLVASGLMIGLAYAPLLVKGNRKEEEAGIYRRLAGATIASWIIVFSNAIQIARRLYLRGRWVNARG